MISVSGAREHNLKDVDIEFGDGLTAVTGVSGSGKTSLVFDTLYHEARRRFLETYAIGEVAERLAPAAVDGISGLGPAVALGQNLLNRNPNSTVASAAGLYPFLRILYARFGRRSCPDCGTDLAVLSEDEAVERLVKLSGQGFHRVYALLVYGVQGSHRTLLQALADQFGTAALHVDGQDFRPENVLDPRQGHEIAVLVSDPGGQLTAVAARDLVQRTRSLGSFILLVKTAAAEDTLSLASVCAHCGYWFSDLQPTHFHSPCPHCTGEGCARCAATGLLPEAAAVRWQGLRLPELLALSVSAVHDLFAAADLPQAAERLRSEIDSRLLALKRVGLGYLSLDRSSPTLSRGESQRIRLAVTLTSRLEDMLHVFDEPTIGQHPADTERFLPVLRALPGPVIYVEHDQAAVAGADQVIDLGPGPGKQGGRVVFSGKPGDLWQSNTASGRFFSGRAHLIRHQRSPGRMNRTVAGDFIEICGANLHNLADLTVRFPLRRLTAVTGVSGSGKSTLIEDVLAKTLSSGEPAGCQAISGPLLKPIMVDQSPIGRNPRSNPATYTKLADIIRDLYANETGLSPSHFSFNRPEGACPSCGGIGAIEIKMRYLPSSWIPCTACDGQRFKDEVLAAKVDFNGRTLSIADFFQLPVSDVLLLLAATTWLPDGKLRSAQRILQALFDVGLGYLSLGQPSPSLSGGEAQRVKLARFLGRRSLDRHLLILDEPTTGLHPQDVSVLLAFLDRLVDAGGTVIAVEHNLDFIRAADWVVDLGPGAGPHGGRVLYNGPFKDLEKVRDSLTAAALRSDQNRQLPDPSDKMIPRQSTGITVKNARVHNLRGVDVTFARNKLTVVSGVSGSGKSSLVSDVLEVEARRRFLETLSLYERQAVGEGMQADVDSVSGLGVTVSINSERSRRFDQRANVGSATEIALHLAALLAWSGERVCLYCSGSMVRVYERDFAGWVCSACEQRATAEPRQFIATNYAAACTTCNGVGTMQIPNPEKLIVDASKPLCAGAMYSPGFFPKGYLCKPLNFGYDMVRALGERYGFDPATTAWNEMDPEAQEAFLYGDEEPMVVYFRSRTKSGSREIVYPGFYGFIRDWDVGGTYTDTRPCPACAGAKLRPSSLAVTLGGHNMYELSRMPLAELSPIVAALPRLADGNGTNNLTEASLVTVTRRLSFLLRVGLGYLHFDRPVNTLSAGEVQRIKLAALLGSGLRSLTVLIDEPTRGLHPSEVDGLIQALLELRDEGNTVIVVEHDTQLIKAADWLIDIGPGAGTAGGRVMAQGTPEDVAQMAGETGRWLREGDRLKIERLKIERDERNPTKWLTISGARANNLRGDEVRLPLGMLTGVCGVSGSGKSTLLVDTLGRELAPKKQTTSVAYEPVEPGEFESIAGAPRRTILVDQAKAGVTSPLAYLGLERPLRQLFAATGDAHALGVDDSGLQRRCSACKGSGLLRFDMGFLPSVSAACETCRGSGYLLEAWQIHWRDICLPDLVSLTIDEVHHLLRDEAAVAGPLAMAMEVGLGYLVLRQPGSALSGGEAQRLKIARELTRRSARKRGGETLFILDEPTVGLHLSDVQTLAGVLNHLVDVGHSVVLIEHHPSLLAACDWLIELGPAGGPDGGRVIANGTPRELSRGDTPTAPYLRAVLEGREEIR